MSTSSSCAPEVAQPVVFQRRGGGLALAEVGPVAYWLTWLDDVREGVRVRLVAQWHVQRGQAVPVKLPIQHGDDRHAFERRAQVGAEWAHVSHDEDIRIARERIGEHHDDIVEGRVEGRTIQ